MGVSQNLRPDHSSRKDSSETDDSGLDARLPSPIPLPAPLPAHTEVAPQGEPPLHLKAVADDLTGELELTVPEVAPVPKAPYVKPITSPKDHPLLAELYWAYTLCTVLQCQPADPDSLPMLDAEGCYRLLRGHGQEVPDQHLEAMLRSLGVVPDSLGRGASSLRRWVQAGRKGNDKARQCLDFPHFLAVLMAWDDGGGRLGRLHHFRRKVFQDVLGDWMLVRPLWVGICLTAFLSFPFSLAQRWVHDTGDRWADAGLNATLADAILFLLAVVPYFFLFGTLGWCNFPGMKPWLVIGPITACCLLTALTVYDVTGSRKAADFGSYAGAIHGLNVATLLALLVAYAGLFLLFAAGRTTQLGGMPVRYFWELRADRNREFVRSTMESLAGGIHEPIPIGKQKWKESLREVVSYALFREDRAKSPIFVASSMLMTTTVMVLTTMAAAAGLFYLLEDWQVGLYRVATNLTAVASPSKSTMDLTATTYGLTTVQVQAIYGSLTSNSSSTVQSVADVLQDLADVLLWSSYPMIVLGVIALLLQIPFVVLGHVSLTRQLRGLKTVPKWELYNMVAANALFGNAWAIALTGIVIFVALGTSLLLCFTWSWLFNVWWQFRAFIFIYMGIFVVQTLMAQLLFGKRVLTYGGRIEKFPLSYQTFALVNSSVSLLTSLTAGVIRLLSLMGLSSVWFVRMDYCVFPRGRMQMWDVVWKAWFASVIRFEISSNPFVDVFRDVLCQQTLGLSQGTLPSQQWVRPLPSPQLADSVHFLEAQAVVAAKERLLLMYPWLQPFLSDRHQQQPCLTSDDGNALLYGTPSNTPSGLAI